MLGCKFPDKGTRTSLAQLSFVYSKGKKKMQQNIKRTPPVHWIRRFSGVWNSIMQKLLYCNLGRFHQRKLVLEMIISFKTLTNSFISSVSFTAAWSLNQVETNVLKTLYDPVWMISQRSLYINSFGCTGKNTSTVSSLVQLIIKHLYRWVHCRKNIMNRAFSI